MMRKYLSEQKKENAQGLVEFALILPILLLVVVGVLEMGRLLFVYSSVTSASREGARYGSAVGQVNGVPRYQDCGGIRSAALKAGAFANMQADDIAIAVMSAWQMSPSAVVEDIVLRPQLGDL